mgnify:CR=1 FL=1
MQVFKLFLGIVALVIGIKLIYDARPIAKAYFSFNDKNIAVVVLKVFGFILTIIGVFLLKKYLY